jgi:hypothetical protein
VPPGRDAVDSCVYGGTLDKLPFGAVMHKGLTIRTGQTHVNRWTDDLLRRIEQGQIDPAFVVTHTVGLEEGYGMYKTFRDKEDGIKVVFNLMVAHPARNCGRHSPRLQFAPDALRAASAIGQPLAMPLAVKASDA